MKEGERGGMREKEEEEGERREGEKKEGERGRKRKGRKRERERGRGERWEREGLNDAPQRWWNKFDAVMTSIGFTRSTFDVCVCAQERW